MTAVPAPTDRASAENYVHATLTVPEDMADMMRWDDLMADLYRAAEQTWNVHLIDHDEFWAIVWANRTNADKDDRANLVRLMMAQHADSTFGFDAKDAREQHRRTWEQRRAATEHRTYAVPFDDAALALSMTPDEYDRALTDATSGDRDFRPFRRMAGMTYNARGLFDVLVLA